MKSSSWQNDASLTDGHSTRFDSLRHLFAYCVKKKKNNLHFKSLAHVKPAGLNPNLMESRLETSMSLYVEADAKCDGHGLDFARLHVCEDWTSKRAR